MSSKETFSAGQTREFYGDGDFFRLLETTAGINVEFFYQGREVAEMIDVEAGYAESFAREQKRFDRIRIYSATAQDVKWVIREGSDVRYDRGAASITGSVDLNAATLEALKRKEAATGSFFSKAALAANTAETVFTPASNTNGATVYTASISTREVTMGTGAFIEHNAAPNAITQGKIVCASTVRAIDNANGHAMGCDMHEHQFIPAGVGLYFLSEVVLSAGGAGGLGSRTCRYRLH